MTERPILFNGEMVRAILDGTKTQTRRCVKPILNKDGNYMHGGNVDLAHKEILEWRLQDGRWFGLYGYTTAAYADCPYGQVGDRLWVRETFIQGWEDVNGDGEPDQYDQDGNENPIKTFYRADGHIDWEVDGEWCNTPWKPSIHMPRNASRITLEITNVRVQRLQEISANDCIAEGIKHSPDVDPSHEFQELWDSIYKNWSSNSWVWVIEFKRVV
ncbi:hypothetical protein ICN48_05510 [Polynucleobacter sp. JS-Safj-400b-B2]|uniref:hypothetical protein n=1 Tax=Polynucleobacter sp. JS-Safj-400b-B2 TaxID=2576921 RepID=UPI001C0D492C|nr:hypothetical protein [Polynucleobacter sp. JS-Safj-400b-B2]MBU3625691.1 hypothetical protein [Polynucleobacter sp. JS-Safj-400b-B2]